VARGGTSWAPWAIWFRCILIAIVALATAMKLVARYHLSADMLTKPSLIMTRANSLSG
jgi:hypothetical protein